MADGPTNQSGEDLEASQRTLDPDQPPGDGPIRRGPSGGGDGEQQNGSTDEPGIGDLTGTKERRIREGGQNGNGGSNGGPGIGDIVETKERRVEQGVNGNGGMNGGGRTRTQRPVGGQRGGPIEQGRVQQPGASTPQQTRRETVSQPRTTVTQAEIPGPGETGTTGPTRTQRPGPGPGPETGMSRDVEQQIIENNPMIQSREEITVTRNAEGGFEVELTDVGRERFKRRLRERSRRGPEFGLIDPEEGGRQTTFFQPEAEATEDTPIEQEGDVQTGIFVDEEERTEEFVTILRTAAEEGRQQAIREDIASATGLDPEDVDPEDVQVIGQQATDIPGAPDPGVQLTGETERRAARQQILEENPELEPEDFEFERTEQGDLRFEEQEQVGDFEFRVPTRAVVAGIKGFGRGGPIGGATQFGTTAVSEELKDEEVPRVRVETLFETGGTIFTEEFTQPVAETASETDVFGRAAGVQAGVATGGQVQDVGQTGGSAERGFGQGLVEIGNIPQTALSVKEGVEVVGFAGENIADEGVVEGAETTGEAIADEGEEKAIQLAEFAEENPGQFVGTVLGSTAGSVALMGGGSAAGVGRGAAILIQPGEELAIGLARAGAVPARAARLVPGVRRGHIGDVDGGGLGVGSRARLAASRTRRRLPSIDVRFDPDAGLFQTGPSFGRGNLIDFPGRPDIRGRLPTTGGGLTHAELETQALARNVRQRARRIRQRRPPSRDEFVEGIEGQLDRLGGVGERAVLGVGRGLSFRAAGLPTTRTQLSDALFRSRQRFGTRLQEARLGSVVEPETGGFDFGLNIGRPDIGLPSRPNVPNIRGLPGQAREGLETTLIRGRLQAEANERALRQGLGDVGRELRRSGLRESETPGPLDIRGRGLPDIDPPSMDALRAFRARVGAARDLTIEVRAPASIRAETDASEPSFEIGERNFASEFEQREAAETTFFEPEEEFDPVPFEQGQNIPEGPGGQVGGATTRFETTGGRQQAVLRPPRMETSQRREVPFDDDTTPFRPREEPMAPTGEEEPFGIEEEFGAPEATEPELAPGEEQVAIADEEVGVDVGRELEQPTELDIGLEQRQEPRLEFRFEPRLELELGQEVALEQRQEPRLEVPQEGRTEPRSEFPFRQRPQQDPFDPDDDPFAFAERQFVADIPSIAEQLGLTDDG